MRFIGILKLFLLVSVLFGCAVADYKTLPESEQSFSKVEQVNVKKSDLYLAIQQWFAENLGKSNEALQIQDKEAGILVGRIIIPNGMQDALGIRHDLQSNIKVEVKDYKFRITISDFTFYYQGPGRFVSPGKEHQSSMETASNIATEIYNYVLKLDSGRNF